MNFQPSAQMDSSAALEILLGIDKAVQVLHRQRLAASVCLFFTRRVLKVTKLPAQQSLSECIQPC